jgi:tyrosine-protein phosphatase YwqE
LKFPLFHKKSAGRADFSFLGTDLHSHLIPGIDDGSPDLGTSVELIRALHDLGYRRLITTPHVMQGYYPNDASTILPRCEKVREELQAREIPVELRAAAEYFLDAELMETVNQGVPLLTLSGNKVLVEMSFVAPPLQLHEFLYQLQIKGYEPVVAHPERYGYFHKDPQQYKKLLDVGCLLQLNVLSLTGHYGRGVKKAALKLLEEGWVSYLGTDLHHFRHADGLRSLATQTPLMKRLRDYPWKNHAL